jgi:DNA modification methylase
VTATADYHEFLEQKALTVPSVGRDCADAEIHESLFEFQRLVVRWAVRKGRCAMFEDTGLGKTRQQLEWARLIGERTLIVAPLAVNAQTIREAAAIGLDVGASRDGKPSDHQITITNYEQIEKFSAKDFGAVVLDESSILKSIDGKTRGRLIKKFKRTPYRLCCTATPAPNDISELANHAEFLGIMTRQQMLATFFVNNSSKKIHGGWRLKGHAEQAFYRWLATWGMSLRKPSDIGCDDGDYRLPPLRMEPIFVASDYVPEGFLFFVELQGITDRIKVRQRTLAARVGRAAELVNASSEQWIVWCGLNEESAALAKAIPDAVTVDGSDDADTKAARIVAFQDGETRVLVTKPKIAGFGLNLQACHNMVFVGLSDSWEAYYQCIRRCYRFGQTHEVTAKIVLSEPEKTIWANVMRKEKEAQRMADELVKQVSVYEKQELKNEARADKDDDNETATGPGWVLHRGDSCEILKTIATESIGLSVFSPPFATLFSYSDNDRDLGNSKDYDEFFAHSAYITKELLRVTQPGRNCCVHCTQIARRKVYDGVMGCRDFRGDLIRHYEEHGWIYHGEVCIDKDPQAQAIRTKAHGLMFITKERDSGWLRPAYADYILVFKAPGENREPIKSDVSNDEWIQWARPIWYGIKETETLQYRSAREDKDEKHICPLQLGTIERCVRLWSNPDDVVLSPFAGIGSEGYVAVKHGRDFVGIELKRSYWEQARKNLAAAVAARRTEEAPDLLTMMEDHSQQRAV